jgi:hypothetical protein
MSPPPVGRWAARPERGSRAVVTPNVTSYNTVGGRLLQCRRRLGGESVKIQGESQVLDRPDVDADGRGLGRVIAVKCAPDDPYTVEWFVLRLRGWRRGRRAVPAARADWRAGGGLRVSFARDVVLASPPCPVPASTPPAAVPRWRRSTRRCPPHERRGPSSRSVSSRSAAAAPTAVPSNRGRARGARVAVTRGAL